MSTEENKALIRRWIEEGWNQRNEQTVADEVFDADLNFMGGTYSARGLEAFKRLCVGLRTAFPDVRAVIEHLFGEEDWLALHFRWEGTHQGESAGVPLTGKHAKWQAIAILRFKGGKCADCWQISDELSRLRQMGVNRIPD